MARETWIENDKTHYTINVCVRSRKRRALRIQKQESGVIEETDPDVIEKKLDRIESDLQDNARRELIERESAGTTWGELTVLWKKALEKDSEKQGVEGVDQPVRASTANGYIQSVEDFTSVWNKRQAKDITPADVEDVFKSMRKIGYSNCRMYNVKVAISRCYKWGMMRRMIPGATISPTHGFGISRKDSKRPEILNAPQIVRLITAAYACVHAWRQIWKGAFHTGGRTGELRALKRKHVDLVERKVHFEEQLRPGCTEPEALKDDEWRYVPINDDLYDLFIELGIDQMGPEDYVFPRITAWDNGEQARILRSFCEKIEIPSICFHTLRACWATQLLKNGVPEAVVRKMGGWSDAETMYRYIRLAGIEIEGATDSLSFGKRERPARVLKLVHSAKTAEGTKSKEKTELAELIPFRRNDSGLTV